MNIATIEASPERDMKLPLSRRKVRDSEDSRLEDR